MYAGFIGKVNPMMTKLLMDPSKKKVLMEMCEKIAAKYTSIV